VASYLGLETLQFSGSFRVNALFLGALCPSKSGLMNKHIVKHTNICLDEHVMQWLRLVWFGGLFF
jgi:hypothetical protein